MSALLAALFVYAVALGVLAPRVLRRCERWQRASPRLGLALWTALITSWAVALLSAGLAATAQLSGGLALAGLFHACLRATMVLLGVHSAADAPAALMFFASAAFAARLVTVTIGHVRSTRQLRAVHQRDIHEATATWRHNGRWVTVVNTADVTAYCVPGRASRLVVTTGALRQLSRAQLNAVIAHENAHLQGRHHLCVGWAAILARAFPRVPLLRAAAREVTRLVEWAADDSASVHHGRRTVARALAAMATSGRVTASPQAALPAAEANVAERVRRLVLPRSSAGAASARIVLALAVPVGAVGIAVAVLVPAVAVDPTPLCAGLGIPPPVH